MLDANFTSSGTRQQSLRFAGCDVTRCLHLAYLLQSYYDNDANTRRLAQATRATPERRHTEAHFGCRNAVGISKMLWCWECV